MTFKPMNERVVDYDANGVPIMLIEGTHETADVSDLPTDHVAQGSWSLNLDDKSVLFFNADTEAWG